MSHYRNYYDSTFGTPRPDSSSNKKIPEKSTSSRIASKYGGAYTGNLTSGSSTSRFAKSSPSTDRCHPPISYKSPLSRISVSRSRDPSPSGEKSEKSNTSSSSGYVNPNRLYAKPYAKSISRENTLSPASSTSNLPKFIGNRNDATKYGGTSTTKFGSRSPTISSKEDSTSSSSKYNSISNKNASKEDLSSNSSQKYLNSRFLPKNSIVKSFTAYARPSNVRSNEVSRKNRELLSVIQAEKEQERLSRPTSRCSSLATEDTLKTQPSPSPEPKSISLETSNEIEMETLTVVTRSTSPTLGETKTSFLRSRRIDIAKTIQKEITRPKTDLSKMVDKEIQSDRLDDSTRSSRFVGASRISAAPWSSFLDMKFSSPSVKKCPIAKQDSCESPKSLSRTSSTKSIISCKSDKEKESKKNLGTIKSKLVQPKQLTDKKQLPPQIPKSESLPKQSTLHSLNNLNKDNRKSVLNIDIDTAKKKLGRRSTSASSIDSDVLDPDATDVSENLASCNSFIKSSSSSRLPQKLAQTRKSPSTDVSTGLSSSEDDFRSKKENSNSTNLSRISMAVNSAEEISSEQKPHSPKLKIDSSKNEVEAKSFLMRALAPVTNLFKNNRQSQVVDNFVEPSPDQISENGEPQEKVVWILDPSSSNPSSDRSSFSQLQNTNAEPKQATIILHRVESTGNTPWWHENSANSQTENSSEISRFQQMSEPANMKYADTNDAIYTRVENDSNLVLQDMQNCHISDSPISLRPNNSKEAWWASKTNSETSDSHKSPQPFNKLQQQSKIHHVESGEKPWWLDESAEVPEGVQTYPGWTPEPQEDSISLDRQERGIKRPTMRPVDSGEKPWWLDENSEVPEGVQTYPLWKSKVSEQQNTIEKPSLLHVDSGKTDWWVDHSKQPSEGLKTYNESIPQNRSQQSLETDTTSPRIRESKKIRPVDSGESPWWLQENATPPDGVQVYPNWVSNEDNNIGYKRNDSSESNWWEDKDKSCDENKPLGPENIMESEYQDRYKIRHIDSGDRAWWLNSNENISEAVDSTKKSEQNLSSENTKYKITRQDSGEKAWWLENNDTEKGHQHLEYDSDDNDIPLGDRASPEGLEMPKDEEGRLSPYDSVPSAFSKKSKNGLFISRHTNIDEILGGGAQIWSPMMEKLLGYEETDLEPCLEVNADQVIIHEGSGETRGSMTEKKGNFGWSPFKKVRKSTESAGQSQHAVPDLVAASSSSKSDLALTDFERIMLTTFGKLEPFLNE